MRTPARRIYRKKWMLFMIAVLAVLVVAQGCKTRSDPDDEEEQAAKIGPSPAQISVQNGQTVLTLSQQTQKRLGIETAVLKQSSFRGESTAPAVVLPVQDLANLRNSYVVGQAQLEKTRINLDVARKEYERLKTLYAENQNASQKALDAADGTMRAAETDVGSANQQLALQVAVVRQRWGSVVARWLAADSPELQRILASNEMLVQVTIPFGQRPSSPARISLAIPSGGRVSANFVSPFPRVDPRIQGVAFLYAAPARAGLVPGANLVARLPVGEARRGIIIPNAAVVWSEGQAWVYRQSAASEFSRQTVATGTPIESGYFVTKGFSPGDRIVVRGAQSLLSEELILEGQGGGAGEGDVD